MSRDADPYVDEGPDPVIEGNMDVIERSYARHLARAVDHRQDPDYDDDGSPKYATEAERAAGWAAANRATNLDALSALDPEATP